MHINLYHKMPSDSLTLPAPLENRLERQFLTTEVHCIEIYETK